nr:MAG TPA: alpha GA-binding protein alpha chain [Caudoviricetes sp.]
MLYPQIALDILREYQFYLQCQLENRYSLVD